MKSNKTENDVIMTLWWRYDVIRKKWNNEQPEWLVKCLFLSKNDKKAKKRHGTYSKNYLSCLDQNPKIENFEENRNIDNAKNGSDTEPKDMVKKSPRNIS